MLAIVDTHDLLEVLWTAALAGVGVTAAYGLAILGAARAVDFGRDGRILEAAVYGVVGVLAAAVVVAALVFGIVVMTSK
jgi:hypothetical protein